jgi:hypothetical protein
VISLLIFVMVLGGAFSCCFKCDILVYRARGGVPICFPQFGMMGPMPSQHGFARNVNFELERLEGAAPTACSTASMVRGLLLYNALILLYQVDMCRYESHSQVSR